jgi:DNA replicative helicase MCM subunit Mcm2 (Cdc46/Mcm family)
MAEVENLNMSIEDENEIKMWSKKPRIADMIFNSIGPSIHKHEDVKIALALAMFGGVSKDS